MSKSLVVIPTYNEIENIERIVRRVFEITPYHILVVDDGSPDGTAAKVKELQTEFADRLHIQERAGKQGLGTAYIHGFRWALKREYDYIFEMDADFSHSPERLTALQQACEKGADLSVGSRYCKGGKIDNWPINRVLLSYFASLYVRIILWLPVNDTTAGYKCYTSKVLKAIPLDRVKFIGYAFQIEMKFRAYKLGFKLVEVPITFTDRKFGESKMSMSIFKEAIIGVLKMRFMKL